MDTASTSHRNQENPERPDDGFVGYLSNYEVYAYLTEIKQSGSAGHSHHDKLHQVSANTHMPTLIYETLRYFDNSPCVVQSPKVVFDFVKKISPFGLTKPEKLTILNTRPTQPIDIQAIVEESEERLTEEQVAEILDIVEECIPPPPEPQSQSKSKVVKVKQEPLDSE
jgi:hypothetical protein